MADHAAAAGPSPAGEHRKLQDLARRDLACYGFMALPLAFAGLPVYLHAPDFYARTMGLPLAAIGAVLLVLRAIDALQDPFIGSLIDRFPKARTAIILAGALLLGGGFWMIFHPLASAPLAWFAASVLICTTGFSVVSITLQSLGGLWQASETDRTRITGWREAFGLGGLLIASILPTLLGSETSPSGAFHLLSLVYLPVLGIGCLLLISWLRQADLRGNLTSARQKWLQVLSDPWRRRFFGLVALNTFASAIPAVLVLFFIRDRLEAESMSGLFLLLYFLSGVLAMPLWQAVSARIGKVGAWAASICLAVVTFLGAALLQAGQVEAYAAICALSGIALGADLALPPAILADHIAESRSETETGRMFSVMTLISKASLAVATGLALPLLGLAGYQPGTTMTPDLEMALSLAYAALPCALKLAVLAWLLVSRSAIAPARVRHAQ